MGWIRAIRSAAGVAWAVSLLLSASAGAFSVHRNFYAEVGLDVERTILETPRWAAEPVNGAGLHDGIQVGVAAGFGIGGTATHTPNSTISTPALPGGFVHGPASLTSSTAQTSGVLQLVTVSKVFTSLTTGSPEIPMTGVLNLHFVPEPATLLMLGSGVAALAVMGRRRQW